MLVIRMQRTGRKGHAQFRVVVQDSRRTPTSGKIVAALGHFNPHTKETSLDKEKAAFYLEHGAQPSERVVRLLKAEGVKLPKWLKVTPDAKRSTRNPEKRRSTHPEEPEAPAEEKPAEEPVTDATEEAPAADAVEETAPVEESAPEPAPESETPEAEAAEAPEEAPAAEEVKV